MTMRETFAKHAKYINGYVKKVWILFLSCIIIVSILLPVVSTFEKNALTIVQFVMLPFQIYFFICIFKIGKCLYQNFTCCMCGKSLRYLMLDHSYSNNLLVFGLPDTINDEIKECPY